MANLSDVMKKLHASLQALSDTDVDALEASLEEELQVVKTLKALRSVLKQREQILGKPISDTFILATDLDKELHPERHGGRKKREKPDGEKRPPGQLTEEIEKYLRTFGSADKVVIANHLYEKLGAKGNAVSAAIRFGKRFVVEGRTVHLVESAAVQTEADVPPPGDTAA